MRKILLSFALVLAGAFLFAPAIHAQFTTVTATVTDPNGIPYAGAVLNAVLVPSTGGGYTLNGQPYAGRIGPVTLDSTGSFTVNFGDVTLITPGSPQWQITIDSAAATIQPPLGTGAQTFTYTSSASVISGGSLVNISALLNALAPSLTTFTIPTVSTPYIGQIATRSGMPSKANNASFNSMMCRNFHVARVAQGRSIASVQVVVGNWFDTNSGEVGNGGTKTATCSIEYPAGTFSACKFNGGSTSVSVASNTQSTSDNFPLQVPIPNGAGFWERYYYLNSSGIDYFAQADTNNDACTYGVGVTDQTMGGTVVNTTVGVSSFLLAIVGTTTLPSVCMIGDSRLAGFRDAASNNTTPITDTYIGDVAPSIAPFYGFIQLGVIGELASRFVTLTSAKRKALCNNYTTAVIDEYGVNDITGGATAATTLSNQQTIAGYFTGKQFFLTTLEPVSTSTDNWTTIANQTATSLTQIQAYNESVRGSAQFSWMTDFFDVAAAVESSPGTGLWNVCTPASTAFCYTGDGTHPNEVGYRAIKNLGVVNAGKIHR